jgi:hypothetical protein
MVCASLANHLPITVLLILLISIPMVFGILQVTIAQGDEPVLGYPYLAHGGDNENFTASRFQLNGAATITSMSCQMYIGYSLNEQGGDSTYRFAIYSDKNGQIGELIGQTELGTISKPVGQVLTIDDFQTLDFASPISLQAGTYWLAAVVHGPNIFIDEDQFVQSALRVRSNLNSTTFPQTLSSLQYIDDEVVAIYASGQGTSSVMPPPSVDPSHPGISALSVYCQGTDSATGKLQVFGDLSVYGTSVPQAAIEFFYRHIGETEWQSIGETNTSDNGTYTVDWLPPASGSYLINATYWGSSIYSPVFKAINVLVEPSSSNQSVTVFSVDSNSTVSNLAFNSANAQLSFSVTGVTGTTGYVNVCISKSLVADPSSIQAYIDDSPANFTVSSAGNNWILDFSYHHSSHGIEFDLNRYTTGSSTPTPKPVPELPQEMLLIVAAALTAVAVIVVTLFLIRKKATAQ